MPDIKPIYKPYPFVFGRSLPTGGLGLSGPGGVLWPIYPPIAKALLREKSNNIPTPPFLPSITFSPPSPEIGDGLSVQFSFTPNVQKLLVNSGDFGSWFGSEASIFYSYLGADFFPADVDQSEVEFPVDAKPVVYIIFAYDGDTAGLDKVAGSLIETSAPVDILLNLSGSLAVDTVVDNRTCNMSFSKLILAIYPTEDVDILSLNAHWLYKGSSNNDWNVYVSSTTTHNALGSNIPSLTLEVQTMVIAHPDQTGYASYYWGGITSSFNQTATIPIRSQSTCQDVLGPCWLPHTTFYPLVELGKTPLSSTPNNMLPTEIEDLSYRNLVPGYGLLHRTARSTAAEKITTSSLLYYPSNLENRYPASFQPDYVDTRILYDSCIYPVVATEDHQRINNYWTMYDKMTSELYFQRT